MITVADWKLAYEGFVLAEEALREAFCTLGNGYFATRDAAEEASADRVHYPGTYLGGGYNRLQTESPGRSSKTRIWSICRTGFPGPFVALQIEPGGG